MQTRCRVRRLTMVAAAIGLAGLAGCAPEAERAGAGGQVGGSRMGRTFTEFRLEADLGHLGDGQKEMVALLIEASQLMDEVFWLQAFGEPGPLLESIGDPDLRRYAQANYGPWDRLDDNRPFIDGFGEKPAGARFYPEDMTKEELEQAGDEVLLDLYTMVRRGDDGSLEAVPYSEAFADRLHAAAALLRRAAGLAESADFKRYLELRAEALLTDAYLASDMAWMDMQDNAVDVVIGPIETYEDQLFGAKAAFEAYVLIKDQEWSRRLARYADTLPALQRGLPVPERYKAEKPGSQAQLNAYDVVYYAGDCNAGAKTIAINLPNDERVQLEKGTRRLQLKNAMRAKFDEILLPIARLLIAADQRDQVTFDAFFANTMFHEVAHGLGIKNTLDGRGTVREALQEQASAVEEGKADVLGLYMVTSLHDSGELDGGSIAEHYVTFMTSVFRSIRFGASSAHGKANAARFNFFVEAGAIVRDASGTYRADLEKFREAMDALSSRLLNFQGDGDYEGVKAFMDRYAVVGDELRADLDRVAEAGIPVDVVFEQGRDVLGI